MVLSQIDKSFRRGSMAFHRTPSPRSPPDSPPIEAEWLRMNQEVDTDNRSKGTLNHNTDPLAISFQPEEEEISQDTHV